MGDWISVDERIPDFGQFVLITVGSTRLAIAYREAGLDAWRIGQHGGTVADSFVAYWAPILAPPTGGTRLRADG